MQVDRDARIMSDRSPETLRAYTGLRRDIISLIGEGNVNKVLDVGCSSGVLLEFLRRERGASYTCGIEVDEAFAQIARSRAHEVIVQDLDSFRRQDLSCFDFDLVIFGDVLEHVKDPLRVLNEIMGASKKDADVVISLPNIQHVTAIVNLLAGRWPQRERGLFDKTHLRFFTWKSIEDLADSAGLEIMAVKRNVRFVDHPDRRINRMAAMLAFGPWRDYLTYQFVVRLRRRVVGSA